jgi:hypothetical protein
MIEQKKEAEEGGSVTQHYAGIRSSFLSNTRLYLVLSTVAGSCSSLMLWWEHATLKLRLLICPLYIPWTTGKLICNIEVAVTDRRKPNYRGIICPKANFCGSQWPRSLRRRSAAARLLRLWVRISPEACISVWCEYCVLSGRGLFDELITRPEESYRLWCVVVCDLETSWMRRPWPTGGCCVKKKKKEKASFSTKTPTWTALMTNPGYRGAGPNLTVWTNGMATSSACIL